ncbi:MAG TPA: dTMP kinase [Bacteroidota bacterium]|nr:dTMP kinase [Bacteroidota bacterium]
MLITFEGLDFSGKSTQAVRLVERLRQEPSEDGVRVPVHVFREPGGTAISERIRELLLDRRNLEMTDLAEMLLFSASRAQLVEQVIRPALLRGEIVVCDRYADSTVAYQGWGRGIDLTIVRAIIAASIGTTIPALTLFIDIPVEEIARRKEAAGIQFDRMEIAGREFYERVRRGFLAMAEQEPHRMVRIDGMQSIDSIHAEIWKTVRERTASHVS